MDLKYSRHCLACGLVFIVGVTAPIPFHSLLTDCEQHFNCVEASNLPEHPEIPHTIFWPPNSVNSILTTTTSGTSTTTTSTTTLPPLI